MYVPNLHKIAYSHQISYCVHHTLAVTGSRARKARGSGLSHVASDISSAVQTAPRPYPSRKSTSLNHPSKILIPHTPLHTSTGIAFVSEGYYWTLSSLTGLVLSHCFILFLSIRYITLHNCSFAYFDHCWMTCPTANAV